MNHRIAAAATLWVVIALAVPAAAQGQGQGQGRNKGTTNPGQASKVRPSALPLGTSVRTLGVWLDDADVLGPGTMSFSLSTNYWRTPLGREIDAPTADVAVGLARRVQLSVSLPYYNASYQDGFTAHGRGDTYAGLKIGLLEATNRSLGVAVMPMLEVLSDASVSSVGGGLKRVNWLLPVSVQASRGPVRVYGTGGYFSRGVLFGGGAVGVGVGSRFTLVGSLTHSYSTQGLPSADLPGPSRRRTDASGGLVVAASPAVALFATAGRTISQADQNSATLMVSAGMTVALGRRSALPVALK